MIQRLRRKFTLLATLALMVVILTIMAGMVGLTYKGARQDINNMLTVLSQNNGQLLSKQGLANAKQRLGSRFNTESMFQYRYFSVIISNKNKVQSIVDNHIWTVDRQEIASVGRKVIAKSRRQPTSVEKLLGQNPNQGRIRVNGTEYSYRVTRISPHSKLAVFLDETAIMGTLHQLTRFGGLIGLFCLILFMVLLWLISGVVVRPMVENERRQKQFITNAGHELKTPLAVISANNEMQEMMNGESEWTQSNHVQITRLTRLINRLISIAKLGENPKIELSPINVSEKTQTIVKSFEAVAKTDGKKLQSQVEPDLVVSANDRYYEELVNILLDNAVKYCDDGGLIKVDLSPAGKGEVALKVANSYANGKNQDFTHFFDRFYREDTSHHHGKKGGFGVGLSMVKNLIAAFHGTIKVNWQAGMINFTVTLPRIEAEKS